MTMLLLLAVLAPQAPAEPAEPADRPRWCSTGPHGSAHLAYKPYGNPVFGSDGLTCSAAKPASAEDMSAAAASGTAPAAKLKARKR